MESELLKEGQKRIENDAFQQVEKCETCGKLFWAVSEFESGNWKRYCSVCEQKIRKETEDEENRIKKEGKPRYGYGGQIFAWTLGGKSVFNTEYEPSERKTESGKYSERGIWASGFIDVDKFEISWGTE